MFQFQHALALHTCSASISGQCVNLGFELSYIHQCFHSLYYTITCSDVGRWRHCPFLLACTPPDEARLFGCHRGSHRLHVHFHPRVEHLGDAAGHGPLRPLCSAHPTWALEGSSAHTHYLALLYSTDVNPRGILDLTGTSSAASISICSPQHALHSTANEAFLLLQSVMVVLGPARGNLNDLIPAWSRQAIMLLSLT